MEDIDLPIVSVSAYNLEGRDCLFCGNSKLLWIRFVVVVDDDVVILKFFLVFKPLSKYQRGQDF